MIVHHIEFAKTGHNISGGEVFMLQLMQLLEDSGHQNVLYTTDNGKKAYVSKVNAQDITFNIIASSSSENIHIFFSYLYRLRLIFRLIKNININKRKSPDVIVCHSLFFPNTITTYLLARRFPQAQVVYWHHLLPPRLMYGYRGEFLKRFHMPNLNLGHLILNQVLYSRIIKRLGRGIVVTVNEYYQEKLNAIHKKLPVKVVYPFTRVTAPTLPTADVTYDIVWVGRFQDLKGLLDIPLIIQEINKKGLQLKVGILGDGDDRIRQELLSRAAKAGVSEQIELRGFVTGDAKEHIVTRSRVFLSTSYYESFGLAIMEALGYGLPVAAYDLPTFRVFGNSLAVAPIGNHVAIAEVLYHLLTDKAYYQKQQENAHQILELLAPNNTNLRLQELLSL